MLGAAQQLHEQWNHFAGTIPFRPYWTTALHPQRHHLHSCDCGRRHETTHGRFMATCVIQMTGKHVLKEKKFWNPQKQNLTKPPRRTMPHSLQRSNKFLTALDTTASVHALTSSTGLCFNFWTRRKSDSGLRALTQALKDFQAASMFQRSMYKSRRASAWLASSTPSRIPAASSFSMIIARLHWTTLRAMLRAAW